MSNIKQKSITLITDATVSFTLAYENMGEIIINTTSPQDITIPSATDSKGLWYRFVNMDADATIYADSATPLAILDANTSILLISDGTNWVDGSSSSDALTALILGTSNQVIITDNGDGTITLSTPQDIGTSSTPTFAELKVGTATNYSNFEPDGTYVAVGDATVWKDIDFPIIIRTTGANIPVMTTLQGNITAPLWQVNDYNMCEGQEFIHEWKEGSRVYWHVHMITNGLDTADRYVKWEVEWTWMNTSATPLANSTQSYEYTIPANTPDKTMKLINVYDWIPTGGHIGGHVYARLRRIASSGTAPTSNPWCTMLQLHIECDTFGSRTISAK